MERQRKRIEKDYKGLEHEKHRLIKENQEANKEKDQAKDYMNSIMRDFEWLKRKTDEEQAAILKLEKDRNALKSTLHKIEKDNAENRNQLLRKDQIISTLKESVSQNKDHIQSLIQSIRKIEQEKEEKTQAANKANANLM